MAEAQHTERDRPKRLAIIDGKSVFYRGYYAMPNLSTQDGTPTGGVFGFATMALEVLKQLKPDYVCVAWDKPKTNIRKRLELYPQYKAGRKPPPADFYEQIPVLHELLAAFGWPLYELDDYEADDIMGTLAIKASDQGIDTFLVTSDMDMLQLVDPHIKVYALKKGLSNIELYSPESFQAKYGIRVDQFLDLKSLKGDSSDNIPGVPGIGEKGALDLLKQYETLDGVYDNLPLLKAGVAKKLEAGRDLAYLSKRLASIWTDAPLDLDLDSLDVGNCEPLKIRDILQRLEFRNLVRQLPDVMQLSADHEGYDGVEHGIQADSVVYVATASQLQKVAFDNPDRLFLHSRCAKKHGREPQLLLISDGTGTTYCLAVDKLRPTDLDKAIGGLLRNESVPKAGYDIKSTIKMLQTLGIGLQGVGHDVLVGVFLVNSLRREQSLTDLARQDLGVEGGSLDDLPTDELAERAGEIMAVVRALYARQAEQLQGLPRVQELAQTIEWPVISVLARMEYAGVRLDTDYLARFSRKIEDAISDLEQQIYGYADDEFNIGSPVQLAEVLFDKLQLPKQGIKKGKTGYSTAASELDKLRGLHPIIDLISRWREVTKLKNTYVDTLPQLVDDQSRVHTTFNMTIAQTGRLSSTDPNLQNIPVRTDLGRHIRTAFVAEPGKVLINADYSQFELRLAAHLADDTELIDLFNGGADIHTITAAQVHGRQPDEVTKQMRRDAKVINFGVLYGMSPHGLAVATGMTVAAAKAFIDKYFELRKPLLDYMNSLREKARSDGYVETLFGRRRPTPDIHSSNYVVRQAAERAAINMPIQGTEADLMKMAMIQIQEKLDAQYAERPNDETPKMLLQIHDSVLLECPKDDAEAVAAMLKDTMEHVYKLPVRLDVDVAIGSNWGDL
ncbi:DNA polymerase I [Candidatus Saccharibacteria bacterium]|nr:MAG: DNA polymerase I [Candidatus Saccharibacteria bacterium]